MEQGRDGLEGGQLPRGLSGVAEGPGLLWGVKLNVQSLQINRTESPGRVPYLVSFFCPLVKEGLVLDTWTPRIALTGEEIIPQRRMRTTGHLGKLAASCPPCGWRGDPELYWRNVETLTGIGSEFFHSVPMSSLYDLLDSLTEFQFVYPLPPDTYSLIN